MKLQVKDRLTKTTECKRLDIRRKKGDLIHSLNDGFHLLKFSNLVEWYVHENDFYIANKQDETNL